MTAREAAQAAQNVVTAAVMLFRGYAMTDAFRAVAAGEIQPSQITEAVDAAAAKFEADIRAIAARMHDAMPPAGE